MIKNGISVMDYFEAFPVLKQPQGFILLLSDFQKNYPTNCDGLYMNWTEFRNAVQCILIEEGIPSKFNDLGNTILIMQNTC